jgi:hypothetical protein
MTVTMTKPDHPHVGVLIETLGTLSLDHIEKIDPSDDESASSSKTSDTESITTICTDDEQQRNGTVGERRARFAWNPVSEIREFRRIDEELRPILFYSAYDYMR